MKGKSLIVWLGLKIIYVDCPAHRITLFLITVIIFSFAYEKKKKKYNLDKAAHSVSFPNLLRKCKYHVVRSGTVMVI